MASESMTFYKKKKNESVAIPADDQPNWWKDQTFRKDYCKSIEIEFEMKPPLGMLADPPNPDKGFDRVLSSLGQAPQLHVCELGASYACPACQQEQEWNEQKEIDIMNWLKNSKPVKTCQEQECQKEIEVTNRLKNFKSVKTCQEQECQKEIEVINDLVEKLKVCEENMEKLFAASVGALERAKTKGLLNENFERQ